MASKLEVQVRHCFCCGLTPGTFLIGLYTLLLYALLAGLAIWAISETAANGDKPIYEGCQQEAQGRGRDRRIQFHSGQTTVVVEDSSTYHCSIGMYTEEMKFEQEGRYLALLIAICLYVPLILASVALLAGVALGSPWLLLPWLVLIPLDVIRGLISSVLILVMSNGLLARIATGIFFLGLQFLHISLWILVLAKFQRLRYRHSPHPPPHYDLRQPFPPQQPYGYYGAAAPSTYAYSPQSGRRIAEDEFHQHNAQMNGQHRQPPYEGGPARY